MPDPIAQAGYCQSVASQTDGSRPSTTANSNNPTQAFRVTHPFHPLFRQEFDLIDRRRNWGEDRVYFHDAQGSLKSMHARYTSVREEDPFVSIALGRAYFRTKDLLELIGCIREIAD